MWYIIVEILTFVILISLTMLLYYSMSFYAEQVKYYCIEDKLEALTTIVICGFVVDVVILLASKVNHRLCNNVLYALLLGGILLVIYLLVFFILWKKLGLKKFVFIVKQKQKLENLSSQIKEISSTIKELKKDDTIEEESKNEHIRILKETRKALKHSYSDMKIAIHMMQLKDTLQDVNDFAITTTETKEELVHQLDIIESKQKLEGE